MAAIGTRGIGLFLGIEPAERRSVALMTAHSFFMGCATVFFETAASAAFLARFASAYIPWVYLAAAGVNLGTGAAYARLQRRASFAALMKGTLWFLLSLVIAVRLGFAASTLAWVAFAGLVSYRMISSLTDLEYWAVASRIYDVRQAKRLFGLIGTGEVLARIAGSFSVPLLVRFGGVGNLMLLSAGGLGMCIALLGAVLRPVPGVGDRPVPSEGGAASRSVRSGVREIVTSPYLALVVGVAVLATFGKYFVDFAFLEQMSTLSKGETELAVLLGVFNGVTQSLSLLTRLFLSRPLLARFGIRAGVLVLPLMHVLCTGLTIAFGLFGAPQLVFWAVLANQGVYKTLKHPVDNASFKVLYQPLEGKQRLAAQIAVEVIFAPVVVGVAGAVMLLFSSGMHYDAVRFSAVLLVVFVAWAVAARRAGRAYARKLIEMIRRRIEGNVALLFDDASSLAVLRSRLASDDPAEVCVALDLLQKAEAPNLTELLAEHVSHSSPHVRRYAFEQLLERSPEVVRTLHRRVSVDPAPTVRGVAVKALVAAPSADVVSDLAEYLDDPDPIVKRAAVTALFELPEERGALFARAAVARLAESDTIEERVLAAELAGALGLGEVVRALLEEADYGVRRAALGAAGALGDPELRPVLVRHLLLPRFAQAAALALASQGGAAVRALEPLFVEGADRVMLRRITYVFRLVGGPEGTGALARHIAFPDVAVRGRVIAALDRAAWTADEAHREQVESLLHEESREAAWTLGALRDVAGDAQLTDLRRALEDEDAAARKRLFQLLAMVRDRVAVQRVATHVVHRSKEKRAYAHEVLDLLLDREERKYLPALLDHGAARDRLDALRSVFPQPMRGPDARIHEILARSPRWLTSWTRAVALRDAAARGPADTIARPGTKDSLPMLLIEKVILLKTVPMFETTSEELLAEIAGIVEIVDYAAGSPIFAKGDAGDSMYIVAHGRVRVFDGSATLSLLGEKEIFGELALLDPEPRSASVEAIEDSRLFRLDGDTFTQLMAANVDIVRGVLHVLCERLRRTSAATGRP